MTGSRVQTALLAQTVARRAWGWDWRIVPTWTTLFDRSDPVPFAALDDWPGAQQLKDNDLRSVWRLPLADRTIIAKVYEPPGGWNRVKQILLGPPARREFLAGLYGLKYNLRTVRPIAYGKMQSGGALAPHVLLTEEVPSARTLSQFWLERVSQPGLRCGELKNEIIIRLARFLHQLHAGRFVPADLHPNNILVDSGDDFLLVDLHTAAFHIRPSQMLRISNLADLNQWFQRHAHRSDRLRFLLAYLIFAFEKPSPRLVRHYAGEVTQVTGWKAEALEKKRDKRLFGDNKYFGVLALPNRWTAHVYLQAGRPVPGSPCSRLRFEKSGWVDALQPLLQTEASVMPDKLRLGSTEVSVAVMQARGKSNDLRIRWRQQHRRINRHQVVPLPLALLERRTARTEEAILVTERPEAI